MSLGFWDFLASAEYRPTLGSTSDYARQKQPPARSVAAQYGPQENYIRALAKESGWDTKRLKHYILQHHNKLHLNVLDQKEKQGLIKMFKRYIKKQKKVIDSKALAGRNHA